MENNSFAMIWNKRNKYPKFTNNNMFKINSIKIKLIHHAIYCYVSRYSISNVPQS